MIKNCHFSQDFHPLTSFLCVHAWSVFTSKPQMMNICDMDGNDEKILSHIKKNDIKQSIERFFESTLCFGPFGVFGSLLHLQLSKKISMTMMYLYVRLTHIDFTLFSKARICWRIWMSFSVINSGVSRLK